jgi:glycosyltransferase involved in cell wall biosynthesis
MSTKPVRILFTIPNFLTAGSGRALFHVVRSLDRSRFLASVAVLKDGGSLTQEFEREGIPVLPLPFCEELHPRFSLPFRLWRAAAALRKHSFDLCHSYHYSDNYSEPLICRLAGIPAWVYTKKNMSWGSRAWVLKSFLARGIAYQNHEMLTRFFAPRNMAGKCHFLPRGVNTSWFHPQEPAEQHQNTRPFQWGLVGLIQPRKGLTEVLRSLAQLPECRLLIAGSILDADYYQNCLALVRQLNLTERVQFLGHVEDVRAFLWSLDGFVFPSRSEGCPVALLEAMACGLPVVASRFPGAEEWVGEGSTGLLAPLGDELALAKAMQKVQTQPAWARQMGANARAWAVEVQDISMEARRHEAMYLKILGREETF